METFTNFITKGLSVEKGEAGERDFIGHITVEVVDHDNEFVAINDLLKAFPTYMSTHPTLSDSHSNRGVGYVKMYEVSEFEGHPSIMIKGTVYKADDCELYDEIWEDMKNGKRKGLSIGGSAKEQIPILKNGRTVVMLKKLNLYEIAICKSPSNPLALIQDVNEFAKSTGKEEMVKNVNGRDMIQCTSISCGFGKEALTELLPEPLTPDEEDNMKSEDEEDTKEEKKKETVQVQKPINGHSWEYWNDELRSRYPDEETRGKVIGAMERDSKARNKNLQNMLDPVYKSLEKLL